MANNLFNSGDSSIKADTLVKAFFEGLIILTRAEQKYNRLNPTAQRNVVTANIQLEANSISGTLALPIEQELTTAGEVIYRGFDYLGTTYAFEPGTGDLENASNLVDAIRIIANKIAYVERLILANVVLQTPNTVQNALDLETNTLNITFSLPVTLTVDPDTGALGADVLDYLAYASEE